MKARATILLALVVSLALAPVIASVPLHAQTQYSERLDVYTAGQAGFWSITMNTVATNSSLLGPVDSTAGLTSYRLVAMSTAGVTSDLQVFGVNGYNLLDVPTQPAQGLFLMVNSTAGSAASSVASYLSGVFGTTFVPVGSPSGSSSAYYAPVDFVNVATPVLYKLVPAAQAGFAASVPRSAFVTVAMPFMVVTGSSNGAGFDHTVAIGGVTANVLNSAKGINLLSLIGSSNATLTATTSSGSSSVVIHSLDGVIVSSDSAAAVANHISNFSGSYSLSVGSGKQVKVNATIETQPPTALAYRLVDHGSLSTNQTLGITVVVANTAKAGAISNVTLNDNWWQALPADLQLVSGNYSFDIPSIAAGQNVTETYVLKVLSSAPSQVTIPTAKVTFGYVLSTGAFTGHARLGGQFLQLNQLAPALNVQVRASIPSGSAMGTAGKYLVTITNTGNSPALNVKLDNNTVSSIAEGGGSATISIPVSLDGLAQRNLTRTFSVEYSNTAGLSQNMTTNSVPLMLSHASMVVPFVQLATNGTVTAKAIAAKTLAITYTFTNGGKGSPSSVTATTVFPQGVGCTVRSGIGNCTGGGYSMTTSTLTTQRNNLNITFGADNYFIPAATILSSYEGMQFSSYGGAFIIPAGLSMSKSFSPSAGFPGTGSLVTIAITNVGTRPVFNATVSSGLDSFDAATGSTGATSKTYAQIGPNSSFTFNYPVALTTGTYGNLTSNPVAASFLFAGAVQTVSLGQSIVAVYRPVTATIHTSPSSPQENHDFTMTVTISNSAGVSVSNVVYTLSVPSGVTVVSGASVTNHQVTVNVPSMAANSAQNVTLKLNANTGLTIDASSSHLTFQYAGATLQGAVTAGKVVINVDSTTRYTIPIAVAVLAALVAVVYVRRKVGPAANP